MHQIGLVYGLSLCFVPPMVAHIKSTPTPDEYQHVKRPRGVGWGGVGCTPNNGLYAEALPNGSPLSGFRYMKG